MGVRTSFFHQALAEAATEALQELGTTRDSQGLDTRPESRRMGSLTSTPEPAMNQNENAFLPSPIKTARPLASEPFLVCIPELTHVEGS